ncbi:MAG TPA: hypothetical protein VNC21_14540 [Vicinamibacterales bacterium]|nr:hypothetical protein [Vicinamibacterales bacterium]
MTCLNDIQIQALADGESTSEAARHAAECAACGARLRERERTMTAIRHAIDVPVAVPAHLARKIGDDFRLKAEATGSVETAASVEATRPIGSPSLRADGVRSGSGATRLRSDAGALRTRSGGFRVPTRSGGFRLQAEGRARWIYSGVAVAAATIIAVIFIAPMVKGPEATVSASEILAKSASQLSAAVGSGVEMLEYELVLDGVPKEMLPDQVDGVYKVRQAIDHGVPGRFRFASYTPDGRMLSSIAEDPLTKRRVAAFTVEGQPYRFDMSLPAQSPHLSLPEMQQLHMQASITMMQASGNQLLETIDGPNGKLYRIEVPHVAGPGTNPVWDLTEARVLIDARDYRVTEFAVRGSFLKQSYSMSYKLISRAVVATVAPDVFTVPSQPGEIVVAGEGTSVAAHDVAVLALRELTKMKRGQ